MWSPLFFVDRVSERAVVLPVVFARARLALSALDRLPIRLRADRCGAMENTRSSSSRASAEVRTSSLARESAVSCEWVVSCEWEVSWEEWVLGSERVERRGSAAVEAGREAAVEEGRDVL